jgi:ABC-type Co2+ transport system permease subunit
MTHPFQSDQPPMPPPPPPPDQGDVTGGLIPYKNPQALTAYYMGIFGLFPAIGFVLAVPAVILGIVGLRKYGQNPVIKGSVHAWVGIVLGGLSMLYNGVFIVIIVVAWIGSP